ncbi:hypothetical protein [Phaffia rhodozyma]|uniref:Protein CPL1-like domain-containing protein n=1 Tax=Phaffia rhodozyma TaxID=264483 RepID=A0A0F7SFZ2_PHARH|nr:hypothetical protein [Phaffia rhodozyma]
MFYSKITVLSLACLLLALAPSLVLAQPVHKPAAGLNKLASTDATPVGPVVVPRAPAPSRRMGKRSPKQKPMQAKNQNFSQFLCSAESPLACPNLAAGEKTVSDTKLKTLANWFSVGFECIEPKTELKSCGGCVTMGTGQDCSAISHVDQVGCEEGRCVVASCVEGYSIGRDNKSCVKKAGDAPIVAGAGTARKGLTRNAASRR